MVTARASVVLLRQDFPAKPESVPSARRAAHSAVAGLCDEETAQVIVHLVSELVTNAIQAITQRLARTPPGAQATAAPPVVTLALGHADGVVRIEVADPILRAPAVRVAHEFDEGGRGLYLVALQSRCWGWEVRAHRKIVWCEVALRAGCPTHGDRSGPA
ncbi:hypothetical protein C3Y87_18615 [Carbonactinospora thermoautotrophica]|uniref:ATP-binding protein n=1 Tax=Carbonactinospora thermoautotrophica TaxID=1469144 RepID=UPI002271F691|nr:ATP-binding protein [Carbonactinospora thermoautotrophica]MCX9193378.1 hypothetical protein [Carbonactinospora thermoautotrophica]